MRVIAGELGGRRLNAPKGTKTRPTIDRVKEAVFSTIAPHIEGKRVLDAFSGTGALGIEAYSRGACSVLLIEKNPRAFRVLCQNLEDLGIETVRALEGDCLRIIPRLKSKAQFDVIFLDPPYNKGYLDKALKAIKEAGVLAGDGMVVIETNAKEVEKMDLDGYKFLKKADYGDTSILYCGKAERSADSGESKN